MNRCLVRAAEKKSKRGEGLLTKNPLCVLCDSASSAIAAHVDVLCVFRVSASSATAGELIRST